MLAGVYGERTCYTVGHKRWTATGMLLVVALVTLVGCHGDGHAHAHAHATAIDELDREGKEIKEVAIDCGSHRATSCAECTQGNGMAWCSGDCVWIVRSGSVEGSCATRAEVCASPAHLRECTNPSSL